MRSDEPLRLEGLSYMYAVSGFNVLFKAKVYITEAILNHGVRCYVTLGYCPCLCSRVAASHSGQFGERLDLVLIPS